MPDTFLHAGLGFLCLLLLVLTGHWQRKAHPDLFLALYGFFGLFFLYRATRLTWSCVLAAKSSHPCGLWRIAAVYLYIIGGFAALCLSAHLRDQETFQGLTRLDGEAHHLKIFNDFLYFSTATVFTVGYGDITPKIWWSKLLTALYIIAAFALQLLVLTFIVHKAPVLSKSETQSKIGTLSLKGSEKNSIK